MSHSFFISQRDAVFAAGSNAFAAKISATPEAFGLNPRQASDYASLNDAFQAAYRASLDPATRTMCTVAAKNDARTLLHQSASSLAKIIDGTPSVTDTQRIDLGLAVRGRPSSRPAPGTPFGFSVSLQTEGSLMLAWKCKNPKGTTCTMYQVFRRAGAGGQYTYLGGTGKKEFLDDSIPAGSLSVTYRVQAIRSTAAGAWAEYNVNFGTSGSTLRRPGIPADAESGVISEVRRQKSEVRKSLKSSV